MPAPNEPDRSPSPASPALLGALALLALYATGAEFTDSWALQLGSLDMPTIYHQSFLAFWCVFGALAVAAFTVAGARWARPARAEGLLARLMATPDRTWILACAAAALAIPALIRTYIFHDAGISDDEAAYRFMAELLASGRVSIESPELKLFYDRDFMINDGKYYSQYFLGWPALMVPGVLVGAAGYMNALYSAATIPALYLAARRIVGAPAARAATLLYLTAPMIQFAAATGLSHTSCAMALTWLLWFTLRARDEGAPLWADLGVGAAFSVAFFIRPTSAIGVGIPLLLWWLWGIRGRRTVARAAAFAGPSVVLAAAFLAVNKAQTGSALTPAYQMELPYHVSNGYRFSRHPPGHTASLHNMAFDAPLLAVARNAIAWLRFNFALFGWPCSLLFAFMAAPREHTALRALAAGVVTFGGVHFFLSDSGIDVFGPTHYFELSLPVLVLSAAGLARASRWASGVGLGQWPAALMAACVATALLGYTPIRTTALEGRGLDQSKPFRMAAELDIRDAVVFAPKMFNYTCESDALNLWVHRRPISHPALDPSILWVNHVTTAEDRAFMALHPDRQGFIMAYSSTCDLHFVPVDSPTAEQIAPAVQVRPPLREEGG